MVNYAYAFSQSESGKYFEWIIIHIIPEWQQGSSAIALKTQKFIVTQCACINDGVTLKKKFTAPELKTSGWIISQKRKKKGNDSINRDDPDEYMRTRLQEDFNSIQLIACSRLFPVIRIVPQRWALRTINDLCTLVVIVTILLDF